MLKLLLKLGRKLFLRNFVIEEVNLNILVTGGAGYIGSHVVLMRHPMEQGPEIIFMLLTWLLHTLRQSNFLKAIQGLNQLTLVQLHQ